MGLYMKNDVSKVESGAGKYFPKKGDGGGKS